MIMAGLFYADNAIGIVCFSSDKLQNGLNAANTLCARMLGAVNKHIASRFSSLLSFKDSRYAIN